MPIAVPTSCPKVPLPRYQTLEREMWWRFSLLVLAAVAVALAANPQLEEDELAALKYVNDLEQEILARNNEATEASWAYESNLTEDNLKQRNEIQTRNANYFKVGSVLCLFFVALNEGGGQDD